MMAVDPTFVSLISACTALVASITGPLVALYVARVQIKASVHSANRQKWIEEFRDTVTRFCGQIAVATQVREKVFKEVHVRISEEPRILNALEKLSTTSSKIRLLVNLIDYEHIKLVLMIEEILILFGPRPLMTIFKRVQGARLFRLPK